MASWGVPDYGATDSAAVNLSIVIGAAVVALLAVVSAAAAVARVRMQSDERVAEAVRRLAEGMHDTMRELADAVETAHATPRHDRHAVELAASLDIEQVAQRTLEAAGALPGVEAALLEASGPPGQELTAAVGFQADEAERTAIRLPENDNLRAVEITYRYRLDDVGETAALVRSGVVLPVRADGAAVGTLSAFSRASDRPLSEPELDELERLAFRAGPALDNARRYAEARSLADFDPLTGLHNRRHFHETLAREVSRAHRYGRRLTLVLFDLDDFKAVNDRVGHLAGDAALKEVGARMRSVMRAADVACRVGGDEFGVILPESGPDEGRQLADRVVEVVRSEPIGQAGALAVSAGVADLREGDDAERLFERADQALYRAKDLGKSRSVGADGA
jgi:diguanylate cyclase (GGDEF)-like protein